MLVSTIFAPNAYRAFFGDIERGEGYLGVLYFLGFFIASLIIFDKEDWLRFFKLSLITGAILFVHGLIQYDVYPRIQSFIGNPAFLAVVFIFVAFAALVILALDKDRLWRSIAGVMLPVSFIGVFLTETRSAMLGILAGFALAVFYLAVKGRGLRVRKVDVQKVSVGLIVLGTLLIATVIVTYTSPLWESIPGVNRLTTISSDDPTVQTRLISAGVSLEAVNPSNNNWMRTLFGWGPDSFNVAYNKHYNPEYLRYEGLWFDRAHNKLLDVLVMNGVLGFLAYLGIWASIIFLVFRKRRSDTKHDDIVNGNHQLTPSHVYISASVIFFAAAYFVQNLFLFDQISTYIPLFAFIGFTIFYFSKLSGSEGLGEREGGGKLIPYSSSLIAIFFLYFFVASCIIPFYQSARFISSMKTGNMQYVYDNLDSFTKPYNFAQAELRYRLLQLLAPHMNNPDAKPLVDRVVALQEEVVVRESYDPREIVLLAGAYQAFGDGGEIEAYSRAEKFFLKALDLSPDRQELIYNMAIIYADQGDFVRMNEYANRMLQGSPDVPMTKIYYANAISREGPTRFNEAMDVLESALDDLQIALDERQVNALRAAYNQYLNYFYDTRDAERFLVAMERSMKLEVTIERINEGKFKAGIIEELPPKRSEEIARGIELFKELGWAAINRE